MSCGAPHPTSPPPADELSAKTGDILTGLAIDDGWWRAQNRLGVVGMFPGNYVEVTTSAAAGAPSNMASQTRQAAPVASKAAKRGAAYSDAVNILAPAELRCGFIRYKANRHPQYVLWARHMAILVVLWDLFFGFVGWLWMVEGHEPAVQQGSYAIAYYTMGAGVFIYVLEYYTALKTPLVPGVGVPLRGLIYMLLSAPMWATIVTMLAGAATMTLGAVSMFGVLRGETSKSERTLIMEGKIKPPPRQAASELAGLPLSARVSAWLVQQVEGNELGKWLVLIIYFSINLVYGIILYQTWSATVRGAPAKYAECLGRDPENLEGKCLPPLSHWAPWAKTFGGLLNLNCALLLLPVLRGLLRALNNIRCGDTGTVASFVPLRSNIALHKLIGRVVGIMSALHVAAHFVNYAEAGGATIQTFPKVSDPWYGVVKYAPFITGAIVTYSLLFIISAANNTVKHASYEIFWKSHHGFVVFYITMLFHGPVFVYWCIGPMIMYALERIWRVQRGNRRMFLRSVKYIEPVLCLEVEPEFKHLFAMTEGQYCYINVPCISANAWHPFTISSAQGDLTMNDFVTFNIRVHGEGSWTGKLLKLLQAMNPTGEYPFLLYRRNNRGERVLGKDRGPDGQPLIRIDGPHVAPNVHYAAYQTSVVIGAGIGVTPLASILRGVLRYKWKRGYRPQQLYGVWSVRQSEIAAYQWFIQALTELAAERARDVAAGNVNAENTVEIHLFVTRVRKDVPVPELLEAAQLPPGVAASAPFTPARLMEEMTHPSAKAKDLLQVMSDPRSATNKLGEIWVWDGRPQFDPLFAHVKARRHYSTREVGVCFCGPAIVGKDLKSACRTHSRVSRVHGRNSLIAADARGDSGSANDCLFVLHKENF